MLDPPRKKRVFQQFSKLIHLKMFAVLSQILGSVPQKATLVLHYWEVGEMGEKLLGLWVPQTLWLHSIILGNFQSWRRGALNHPTVISKLSLLWAGAQSNFFNAATTSGFLFVGDDSSPYPCSVAGKTQLHTAHGLRLNFLVLLFLNKFRKNWQLLTFPLSYTIPANTYMGIANLQKRPRAKLFGPCLAIWVFE